MKNNAKKYRNIFVYTLDKKIQYDKISIEKYKKCEVKKSQIKNKKEVR